jgi:serine/threonine-protein kinase
METDPTIPQQRVARPDRDLPPPLDALSSACIGPFSCGQLLAGAYEITGVLGAGAMGVVYEAQDLALNRAVAIKAPLRPAYAEDLRAEAQAMAAVHHPNLVTIHAMGREGGVDFIVMERVFGMTLDERIAEAWETRRPIPLDEALRLLSSIADALTAIHRAGVAHRDVKSANVMLSGQRVVLTDLGLVTPEISVEPGAPLCGSAAYMAPELILDAVQPGRGALVDLYALGVVAFEVLAGRRPYPQETVVSVMEAHVEQATPDVRSYRGDVPDELAVLVHELLAKRPEDRPEGAEAVLWRLGAILADLPRGSATTMPALSVLIVDDDPAVGAVLKRNLQWSLPRLDAEALTDPAEALDRMMRRTPDIVVVDLNMPGINGIELCMNVRALPLRLRPVIVAMSAEAKDGDLTALRALDVHAFVPKDERFVPHMCEVVGDVRRARWTSPRRRESAPPGSPRRPQPATR